MHYWGINRYYRRIIAGKETKNIMKKAVNDPNYYPKNIEFLMKVWKSRNFQGKWDKRDIKEQER